MSDDDIRLLVKEENCRENTPESIDDIHRKELLWERREENLLNEWIKDCSKRGRHHTNQAQRNKRLFRIFSLPATLIPILLSGFTGVLDPTELEWTVCLMMAGLMSGVSGFFNFGRVSQAHYQYEALYDNLVKDVELTLSKPKSARIACDVFLEQVRGKYVSLNTSAPV